MKKVLQIAVIMLLFHTGCTSDENVKKPEVIDGIVQNTETGLWQQQTELPIRSELIKELDLSLISEVLISEIRYPVIDENGNSYFIETRQSKLISVDPEGKLRWVTGKEGRGPGDISQAFGLTLWDGKLYVSNVRGSRIDEYSLEGTYQRSLPMPAGIPIGALMGVNDQNDVVITTFLATGSGALLKFLTLDDSLSVNNELEILEKEEEGASMGSVKILNDEYYYTFRDSYSVRVYDEEGNVEGMNREFRYPMGRYQVGEDGISIMGYIFDPVFIGENYYLIKARYPLNVSDKSSYGRKQAAGNAPEIEWEESISLFNTDHEFLYETTDQNSIDEELSFDQKGDDGYYYEFRNEPVPMIRKFRVTVEE